MKLITLLIFLAAPLCAQSEINTEKIAELIELPGLGLEIEDHTERESRVRNIRFKKVAYVKVKGEGYIYPMVIWIASKGAIEADKYGKLRKLHAEADIERAESLKRLAAAYIPELDNAVISLDEIQMTTRLKTSAIEGDPWIYNTPYVGGLSVTATNEELGLDYQILLTGAEEQDPELAAKYRSDSLNVSDEKYREGMRDLLTLVRDSPMLAAAATKETRSEDRRRERPVDLRNEPRPDAGMSQTAEKHTVTLIIPLWQWIVSLFVIIGLVVFLIRRARR